MFTLAWHYRCETDPTMTHARLANPLHSAVGYAGAHANTDATDDVEGKGMQETDGLACRVVAAFEEVPRAGSPLADIAR